MAARLYRVRIDEMQHDFARSWVKEYFIAAALQPASEGENNG